jgi:predicted enzyme related to lactoylglutathione lyase
VPATIQPVILTADLDRLRAFYVAVFDAVEVMRVPSDGPTFYLGLRIGGSTLGVVAESDAPTGSGRVLISIDVGEIADLDALLPRVGVAGGQVLAPPNDMAWGQRVAHIQDPDGNSVNLTQTS